MKKFNSNTSVKSSDDVTSDNDEEVTFKRDVPDKEVKSNIGTSKCPDSDFPHYL